tara:strand:+ start:7504 stop:7857 length:354 start_codon:yes stop_codon:yes gene_type:complete
MNVKIDDIYEDLKNLVEKTHTAIILEKNNVKYKENPRDNEKNTFSKRFTKPQQNQQETKNITLTFMEKKTQSCQTTTTKQTTPETHIYVSLPPAGRKGTRTDASIINWSRSLRFPYY